MYHFFVEPGQIQGTQIFITGKDVNHIKNVLRMRIGEEISVGNGIDGKEYRCAIDAFEDDSVVCKLLFIKEDGVELPVKVTLFQGLPKADKMELIIQKAVELGVYEIVPVATKRCVVKLDAKKEASKIARWQAIAEAAAKQSKRAVVPQIKPVMTMKEAIQAATGMEQKIIPYELAEGMSKTREIFANLIPGTQVAVFIGPEGGFEESEVEAAAAADVEPVSLGKRILRTETAGFTVLAWIMYALEVQGDSEENE
ncbi:MAG: 16S rRNA (uracil(1498)-N(3))-methyltransferase [Lachnospiraceae bacterium]|nr:16S rRNA (uracil(1498)-N(3))-methyltransferase [Lachnospiraceae bacterium]